MIGGDMELNENANLDTSQVEDLRGSGGGGGRGGGGSAESSGRENPFEEIDVPDWVERD